MTGLKIKSIAHTALKTPDLERSLAFYRDRLGFDEMMRINHADGSLMLVYLRMTDTQYVEIFPGGKGEIAPGWDDTAINHFCLQVEDIQATADDLRARGVSFIHEPKIGLDGNWQCWIGDPDGNRIEFMQMMPGCMQEVAITRLTATLKA
jgi:lactoylglutathione lyase